MLSEAWVWLVESVNLSHPLLPGPHLGQQLTFKVPLRTSIISVSAMQTVCSHSQQMGALALGVDKAVLQEN